MTEVATSTPFTEAVLVALRAIPNPGGGLIHVGDDEAPEGAGPKAPLTFYPYAVVTTGIVRLHGNLVDPHIDGIFRAQVTAVGRDRAGAEWLRDRCREVLFNLEIDGHVIETVELINSRPTRRDDALEGAPRLQYCVEQVDFDISPAAGS